MTFTITKHNVSSVDDTLSELFSASFGKSQVYSDVRSLDDIAYVVHSSNTPIGFVNIRDKAPYKFGDVQGIYLYNLCVVPNWRGSGAGTALLKKIMQDYPVVQLHANISLYKPGWLERLGFVSGNMKLKYIEYTHGGEKNNSTTLADYMKYTISKHYDYTENIMYLDPLY